ncbi:MAG: HAMP domain-containing histidine kinase [Candidatus Kapabacteria bacterium]|nr:HAMP domain-containing histidine kinase [Candidatus Kapabacteria bacterium]MDW8011958.1 HAMP domain-containing sensor histidine kinase [Bacteroidota bacterium]
MRRVLPFRRWHVYALVGAMGLLIVALSFVTTQAIVREIVLRERQSVGFYAEMLRIFSDPFLVADPFLFVLLDHVVPTISFPVIVTDPQGEPLYPYLQNTLNVGLDTAWSAEVQRRYLKRLLAQMREEFPPIIVTDRNGVELARIYYSTSELVRWVRWIPYAQAVLIVALLAAGWWSLRLLRQAEESRLWVVMAKEAAHQLGTPLSSVLGWLELLRQQLHESDLRSILQELERDVARLQSVAVRFSHIGARPLLTPQPVAPIVEEVVQYLQPRLPRSKQIQIESELDPNAIAALNPELFAWAVENILKNGAEAIERPPGQLRLRLTANEHNVVLELSDTGRGIPPSLRHRIFEAGFTTKRRSWGLGLTLARRIIQDYHGGSLYLKESVLGQGSTFVIELPAYRQTTSPRRVPREGSPRQALQ